VQNLPSSGIELYRFLGDVDKSDVRDQYQLSGDLVRIAISLKRQN
jgi:hypothetical protein